MLAIYVLNGVSDLEMAFPKLREFMSEVEKFLDTDIKPFHLSSILPRGARRELDNAVPMTAGFRPSRVSEPYCHRILTDPFSD